MEGEDEEINKDEFISLKTGKINVPFISEQLKKDTSSRFYEIRYFQIIRAMKYVIIITRSVHKKLLVSNFK